MRKKEKIKLLFILVLGLLSSGASAQSVKTFIRKGNKLYEQKKYSGAEVQYRKAQAKNPKYEKSTFNLGDAVYQEKNYKGAENFFKNLIQKTKTPEYKANAWYNLGNTFMKQKKYEKSIGSYIQSLKHQPADMDAKYNLTYARKMLKKQKQQKKKKKQNKKNKKNNKNKKNQNKKNQNKNKPKPQNKQGNQKKNNRKKKQQISPQEAQRILNALKNNEKNTLKKLERAKAKAKAAKAKPNVINW
ncbi:hypothetical protein MNBD_BACTEROID07-358 [hydrothermal vent metagenome]|uniref:Uncharacterized protein n=1 Tax=hydrothermal vent metagenome TaxID=652676 RepID=A0A3B0UBU3_9ZZZZ